MAPSRRAVRDLQAAPKKVISRGTSGGGVCDLYGAQMPGVAAWVSATDVPGENKVKGGASDSPVFADGKVEHMGQVIGLVIADTPRHAEDAAAKVSIQYGHPKASRPHMARCHGVCLDFAPAGFCAKS